MSVRSFFTDLFGAGGSVNPTTGLPMPGGAVDIAGNPYGADLSRHHDAAGASSGPIDLHHHVSTTTNDWSSPSWPDHSSLSSIFPSPGGGYDPTRGW